MKEVIIYVEGPSDKEGMEKFLANKIKQAQDRGHSVNFCPLGGGGGGSGKEPLLNHGPLKALNILRNKPNSWVFLVPDLYPQNKPFPHITYQELKLELERRFLIELRKKDCDERLQERFRVHCFKYDLEALLLASEQVLLQRLGVEKFSQTWKIPVEDQNHAQPPKRIVEALFTAAGKKYKDTADVPYILERTDYTHLIQACPQRFKPFIEDLLSILDV